MTLEEIIAEMQRRPDAQYLLEWIYDHAEELDDAKTAIEAYFVARDDES